MSTNFETGTASSKSHVLRIKCPTCQKDALEKSKSQIGSVSYITLHCGHFIKREAIVEQPKDPYQMISTDGRDLLPFQIETIKFTEKAGGRCIIRHEMGLGKTMCALGMLQLHPEMLPAIVVCKSKARRQWFSEIIRWMGRKRDANGQETEVPRIIPQLIEDQYEAPFPDIFPIAIVGFDNLTNAKWMKKIKSYGYKTLIVDEVQMVKNPSAQRTQALRDMGRDMTYIIGMSGTPIKNHFGEYFVILNLIWPELFPSEENFYGKWVDAFVGNGGRVKASGIRPSMVNEWRRLTDSRIIGYDRADVAPELPKVFRQFKYVDLGEEVEKAYAKEMRLFMDEYDEAEAEGRNIVQATLPRMTKLRHLTGRAKCTDTAEEVRQFLEDTTRKIVVFTHHHDVADILEVMLTNICTEMRMPPPLRFSDKLNADQFEVTKKKFWEDPFSRILIARTLADGESLNLQIAGDCIIHEREWNPPNEEQAEGRFTRHGSEHDQVNSKYIVAVGTIDEYFAEIVERKRAITRQVHGKAAKVEWKNEPVLLELANILRQKGAKRWSL